MKFGTILSMVICTAALAIFTAVGVDLGVLGGIGLAALSAIASLAITGKLRD